MTDISNKVRNCSVDIFRYLCALFVVAIHIKPFYDINENLGNLVCNVICRVGIPFFFAVSGYFYIQKLEENKKPFIPYVKKIVITYSFWSVIYFALRFVSGYYSGITDFIWDFPKSYFITGSSYHFWFFPALVYAVCVTTLFYKAKLQKLLLPVSIILYIIGCLGFSHYEIGIRIPLIKDMITSPVYNDLSRIFARGIPFFVSGLAVFKLKQNVRILNKKANLLATWFIGALIWILEIVIIKSLGLKASFIISPGLYIFSVVTLIVLINSPMPKFEKLSVTSRVLANFTYYAHPIFIIFISVFSKSVLKSEVHGTAEFLLTVILTGVAGFVLHKLNNKAINYIAL